MKKIILVTSLCLSVFTSDACEYKHIIDRAISPASLKARVDQLFQNQDFVDAFIERKNKMSNAQRRAVAQKYQMQKIARWNYIFRTPLIPGYILKLGPIHWTNSFGGFLVRAKEVTNKNVSRVAYQQLIADVVEKEPLKHVCVVQKYLYEIPGRGDSKDKRLCDDNFIVLVEDIADILLSPEENIEQYKYVTEELLDELRIIARQAYVADFKMPNCVFGKDGKIYLIDTEQTNRAHEADFFLKNSHQMAADTAEGLRLIGRLLKVRDDDYCKAMLRVECASAPYYEMGIEPDDTPTLSAAFIALTDKLRELE